jgi:hypothetical protein
MTQSASPSTLDGNKNKFSFLHRPMKSLLIVIVLGCSQKDVEINNDLIQKYIKDLFIFESKMKIGFQVSENNHFFSLHLPPSSKNTPHTPSSSSVEYFRSN